MMTKLNSHSHTGTNYSAVWLGYGNFLLTITQAAILRDYPHMKGNFIISRLTGITVAYVQSLRDVIKILKYLICSLIKKNFL